jgi:hypothetical protein
VVRKTFYWSKTVFSHFRSNESFFSFTTAQMRKIRGKNQGKQDCLFGGLMSGTRYKEQK